MGSDVLAPAGAAQEKLTRSIAVADRSDMGRPGYLGIAEFLRVVRRRSSLILFLAVAGVLLSMIVIAKTVPVYTSTATVMVKLPSQSIDTANPNMVLTPNEETEIETKVELLQSRNSARVAAKSLRLEEDPEFAAQKDDGTGLVRWLSQLLVPPRPVLLDAQDQRDQEERARQEEIVDALINRLDVSRVARSSLIKVTASSTDPVKAARLANRTVETYIRGQIDDARESRQAAIQSLTERVFEVGGHLRRADVAVADYRRQHGLFDSRPGDSGVIQSNQLRGLFAQSRAEAAASSRRAMPAGEISGSSPLLADLRQQEAVLERRLSELGTFYGSGHGDVVKTNAELVALRSRIEQETRRIAADLQNDAAAAGARSATIGSDLAGIRARTFQAGADSVPLRELERNAEAVNTLYMSLLNQLNEKIGTPADASSDLTLVSRAPVPEVPSKPVPAQALAIAASASVALGLLLAFAVEAMDTKLRTAEQVERLLGLQVLSMVPDLSADIEAGHPAHAIIGLKPNSRFAEAMRNLLIELEARPKRGGTRVVVITSPLEGEGKNTTATSLAAAAAVVGRNVVLVDLDLRRPRIGFDVAGPATGTGIVAYLSGVAAIDEVSVREEAQGRFAIIGAGEVPINPGALIASPRLPAFIDQLRRRYDLIILNAPPILPVRDAKTLADVADSTLLVLRWGYTNPEAARIAIDMFDRPITGAVMNMVDYAVHAKRRHGDAIHHIAGASGYYDAPVSAKGRMGFRPAWRNLRRVFGLAA